MLSHKIQIAKVFLGLTQGVGHDCTLNTGLEDLRCRKVLQVAMIGYDVDGGASSFEVVAPTFESVVDGCKFFVMNVVIGLGAFESPGVECDWVVVAVQGLDGQYGS